MLVRVADGALTLDANVDVVFVLRHVCVLDSGDDLLFLDLRVLAAEILNGVLREALFVCEFKVRHHKVEVRECGDVRLQKLRIVGNDRTVIVVGRAFFIEVVGHARIEDRVHALFEQVLDVAVHQLCRIANRIGRDGMLSLHVHIAGGNVAEDGLEAELTQECRPERQQLEVIQSERQTDFAIGFAMPDGLP